MNKIIKSPFVKMCLRGISGAFLGILAGTALGGLIHCIQLLLSYSWILTGGSPLFNSSMYGPWQDLTSIIMFSSSFGALIGAIFGSIFGLNENTKK